MDQKGLKSQRLLSLHQHEPDGNEAEHNHKLLTSILVQFRYGIQNCKGMALIIKASSNREDALIPLEVTFFSIHILISAL